jgi:hypothetical protein
VGAVVGSRAGIPVRSRGWSCWCEEDLSTTKNINGDDVRLLGFVAEHARLHKNL